MSEGRGRGRGAEMSRARRPRALQGDVNPRRDGSTCRPGFEPAGDCPRLGSPPPVVHSLRDRFFPTRGSRSANYSSTSIASENANSLGARRIMGVGSRCAPTPRARRGVGVAIFQECVPQGCLGRLPNAVSSGSCARPRGRVQSLKERECSAWGSTGTGRSAATLASVHCVMEYLEGQ